MSEAVIISSVIAIVGSLGFSVAYWQRFKARLSLVRNVIGLIDDALHDDKVTDEEWEGIVKAVRELLVGKKET